jgi:Domain of unknown function (DUF397)
MTGNIPTAPHWRKSSHSAGAQECVEIATWRKSSRSAGAQECVEVGSGASVIGVRDSKDPEGPVLRFGAGAWRAFLRSVTRDPAAWKAP